MVIKHNCGCVMGHTLPDTYYYLNSVQHRGRDAAGILAMHDNGIDVIKWLGPVTRFNLNTLEHLLSNKHYHTYAGHVRYATKGREDQLLLDAHPHTIGGKVTIHGNHIIIRDCQKAALCNGQTDEEWLTDVPKDRLKTTCDTEALLHYYDMFGEEALMKNIPGAYTLFIADATNGKIMAMRDRHGIRPGFIGEKGSKRDFASEDVAFKSSNDRFNNSRVFEEMSPGGIYYFDALGKSKLVEIVPTDYKSCFFERNYISHPDTGLRGISVDRTRRGLGKKLAEEFPVTDLDFVTYIPHCPEFAAMRFAQKLNKEFVHLFYKINKERSFQGTTQSQREESIANNLHVNDSLIDKIKGAKIGIVDDSFIRGTNGLRAIKMLIPYGVREVELFSYTPKIGIIGENDCEKRGCFYGVDMPPDDKFIVRTSDGHRNRTDEEINEWFTERAGIPVKMHFLSTNGMFDMFEKKYGTPRESMCSYCIGGKKPF